MWVRDRLDGLWCDEDFARRYPRAGRPGLSPARLATVCVLQFLLGLSDRQAAEAVRCTWLCRSRRASAAWTSRNEDRPGWNWARGPAELRCAPALTGNRIGISAHARPSRQSSNGRTHRHGQR
ncbi:transposase [Embleya sp. NPDC020886]|uniref:transposase n=1 Tax=Embleya sp. NPDC020886 TaxID=3363980 RepID=UPI0037898EC1